MPGLMKLLRTFKNVANDPLGSFKILQVSVASLCLLIPVFLRMADGDEFYPIKFTSAGLTTIIKIPKDARGFRLSLSDYVYSTTGYLFGLLYCLAGSLFIYNAVVYRRRRHQLRLFSQGHWYNLFIGLSLIGVVLSPDRVTHFWHMFFTIAFFAGNLLVLFFVSARDESGASKALRTGMAYAVLFALLFFVRRDITLLEAEWFSLIMIGLHLIRVSLSAERDHSLT